MRRLEEPPRKGRNGRKGSHAAFVTLILCRLCFANLWQLESAPTFATSDKWLGQSTICTIFFVILSGVLGFSRQELEAQLSQLAGREAEAKARVLEASARV